MRSARMPRGVPRAGKERTSWQPSKRDRDSNSSSSLPHRLVMHSRRGCSALQPQVLCPYMVITAL
jgi:hypothetical protein